MAMLTPDNFKRLQDSKISNPGEWFFNVNPQAKGYPIDFTSTYLPMTKKPKIRFFANGTCALTTTYAYHDDKYEFNIADHWCQQQYLSLITQLNT